MATRFNGRVPEGQVGWQLYRIWYEAERLHESLDYQTPHQLRGMDVGQEG